MEPIVMVMRGRRLEWFGHVKRKRRDETESIRAVVEMKMEGKRPMGRPKLRWKDNVRRDLKAWNIREELHLRLNSKSNLPVRLPTPLVCRIGACFERRS